MHPRLDEVTVVSALRAYGVDPCTIVLREGIHYLPRELALEEARLIDEVGHGKGTRLVRDQGRGHQKIPELAPGHVAHEQPQDGGRKQDARDERDDGVLRAHTA